MSRFLHSLKPIGRWLLYGVGTLLIGGLLLVFLAVVWVGGQWYVFERGLQVAEEPTAESTDKVLNRAVPSDFDGSSKAPSTVVLVTLDTLRADQLSTYGYPKRISPNLDRFASQGVQFDRAFTSMPTTAPAHATMLTSLYPVQHRVLKNGLTMRRDVGTLQEYLKERKNYSTAAFVSTNRHFQSSRIAKGFDYYDDPVRKEQIVPKAINKSPRYMKYRPAGRTIQKAVNWLDDHSSDRLFLWVHLFDPHYPYAIRDSMIKDVTYSNKQKVMNWINQVHRNRHFDLLPETKELNPRNRKRLKAYRLYDSEIRYLDHAFGRLMDRIRSIRKGRTLTIVAGDHGEGMGNHNYWGHGKYLYNEQIRVPLMVQFPKNRYSGRRVDHVVELNDLMPTVLRETGMDSSVLQERREPMEGTPLQRLLEGDTKPFQYAFTQRRQYHDKSWLNYLRYRYELYGTNPVEYPFQHRTVGNFETGEAYSLINNDKKYIYKTRNRDEYYDLSDDFYEQNYSMPKNSQVGRLGSTLKAVVESLENSVDRKGTEQVDDKTREKLKGLGYF